jgi:rhamnose utilization protein RhaD (predicted bifunctional aldolase and dehydrogenase)
MTEIKDLVEISKYAGERFDLVQGAGGNSSVKIEKGQMLIKASGFLLSEVNESFGYSVVFTKQVANIVNNERIINSTDKRQKEYLASQLLKEATFDKINRPSIETLLHSLLLKFTLHTHSIVVNMISVQVNWKEIFNEIFIKDQIVLVEYKTPGIELAFELNKELKRFEKIPKIIFLQNHGLIVTSNEKSEILELTEYVLKKIENHLNVDMSRYKLTNKISFLFNLLEVSSNFTYLCEDSFLVEQLKNNEKLFLSTPFCPDSFVYCGVNAVSLKSLNDILSLKDYLTKNQELPKVIIYASKLFLRCSSLKRAKEIEDVLKIQIMVLAHNEYKEINLLELEELIYLANWEAEKFRQEIRF